MRRRFSLRGTSSGDVPGGDFDFSVGRWFVRTADGLVTDGVRVRRLEPRVAAVLDYLAKRAGRVVTKDELVRDVWQAVAVSDTAVVRTIVLLRKCLGDDARKPRYVRTIPKRGYELVAEVREMSDTTPRRPKGRGRALGIVAAAALVFAALALLPKWGSESGRATFVVEPFRALDGLAENERWDAALTGELLASLKSFGVDVVTPSASSHSNGAIRSVLTGTVQRDGDEVRVTCALASAGTGEVRCADACTVPVGDRFETQRRIGVSIARAVEAVDP